LPLGWLLGENLNCAYFYYALLLQTERDFSPGMSSGIELFSTDNFISVKSKVERHKNVLLAKEKI